MLFSLALVLLTGLVFGQLCKHLHLPPLIGYIAAGIFLGADGLNALNPAFLALSPDFRRFALIIILLRAGLALNPKDLRQAGRPAILLCFVPACFEILGFVLLGPPLLGLNRLESALLGTVIAAVSPAIIVPRMLNLLTRGLGTQHAVPQMILAGASADDVFVLVVFSWLSTLLTGAHISALTFLRLPISILLSLLAGYCISLLLCTSLRHLHLPDGVQLLVLLSICFIVMAAEDNLPVPFSGMLCILTMGMIVLKSNSDHAQNLSNKLSEIWIAAEILLFVLIGATVQLSYVAAAGGAAIAVILVALCFRTLGVAVSTLKTQITPAERVFTMISYCPKATVQAAIGSIPLAMGLSCGNTVLTVAFISILLTAPLGAFAIDYFAEKLLYRP